MSTLIYIITNRWYRADNMFKVGMHRKGDIDVLIKQYIGRYMPEVDVVANYKVEDALSMERLVHRNLKDNPRITRVKGEWYRGPSSEIMNVIEDTIFECTADPNTIKDGQRVYHLTCEPDVHLYRLGHEAGVINPFKRTSSEWRHMQIFLLMNKDKIIEEYEAGGDITVKTGMVRRDIQPHALYAYVGQDVHHLARVMDELDVYPFKGITRKDVVYVITNDKYQKRMLELMTIPTLKEIAKDKDIKLTSKMKKADIIKAIDR